MDPRQAFDTLKERWEDIVALFDSIPGGEFTPGVYKKAVGSSVQRVELTGPAAAGLHWTGFDMVMEKGNYRLRWFVTPAPKPR